jgi:acetolactate synthase I/II/III large subunit
VAVHTVTESMTAARCLAETLEGYGVTHLFFVPAIATQTLAEIESRTSIERVVTHGEKAAAYMADGYARATGKPGVCMAQAVGGANLAAGLRDAWLAASPVIAITGGPYDHTRGRHTYQQADDRQMFAPLTKLSELVTAPERLPDLLRQAFRAATTGRPGPVHLELEGHLGELDERSAELSVVVEERFARIPAFRPAPEPESVDRAARMLCAAERPVIVAGGGVRASGADAELVELAERLRVPVVTAMDAKDTIVGKHPLNCGVVGVYSRKAANRVVLEADLVFFAGSAMGSQVTGNWRLPAPDVAVIQLDIDPEQLGRHRTEVAVVHGDAKVALAMIGERVDAASADGRAGWLARVDEIVAEWHEEYRPLLESDAVPLRPERLCAELSGALPDDALLVVDTGHAGMWSAHMVELDAPGQGYIRAAGSLGWAFPAGIGAKLAAPDRPVVVFTGDGGLWYHVAELETAVRRRAGIVVVINDNQALNQEIGPVSQAYGGQLGGRHEELWHFADVDLARVAEAAGAKSMRVTKPAEMRGALMTAIEDAESARVPVVVDVLTDRMATAPLAYLGAS